MYSIKEIKKEEALKMIQEYHYSNTLPKINKHFVGFYLNNELVGVVTLGWGTRPKHTIKKIFPSLDTKDYLEIGRMCMTEEMPRNSESQMLSQLVKYIKNNYKDIKVLFTWADGMLGKAGYVYQASNFLYAGYSETDIYLKDGVKIHPRQTRSIFGAENDKRKTIRPTLEQMNICGIEHYRGRQFKYLLFLCNKKERKALLKEALIELTINYPKEKDLVWKKKDVISGKWVKSGIPPYLTDIKINDNNEAIERIKNSMLKIREIGDELIKIIKEQSPYEKEYIVNYETNNTYIKKAILNELKHRDCVADVAMLNSGYDIKLY